MKNRLKTAVWIALTVAATYAVTEWSEGKKSGLHEVREVQSFEVLPVPAEPERQALQAQVDKLAETFGHYRAAKEKQIDDLLRLIANLQRQIQVLTAQRTPVEQVAALRAASRPVRWASAVPAVPVPNLATLARDAGFTKVQVRP